MNEKTIQRTGGGVTAPAGFRAGGVAAGIKRGGGLDLALVHSDRPSVAAGAFTTNKVRAAPVGWCRRVVGGRDVRAILANSGNANACTGGQGGMDAAAMAKAAGDALGLAPEQVLVCSTGRIGRALPIERIRRAVPGLVAGAARRGGRLAAEAIMTSDTRSKEAAVRFDLDGVPVRVGGMAKGAGMIDPTMATMLAFLTTDALVERRAWRRLVRDAVIRTFNRISVDGDMSTNDTVLALANGAAGNRQIRAAGDAGYDLLAEAVRAVCARLARMIIEDGEGASRVVDVVVEGAGSDSDALKAARAIGGSQLVKCAWSGGDPNWGRVLCAAGYSGADVVAERMDLDVGGVVLVRGGVEVAGAMAAARRVARRREFRLTLRLNLGEGRAEIWTNDLTPEYVVYNQSE